MIEMLPEYVSFVIERNAVCELDFDRTCLSREPND